MKQYLGKQIPFPPLAPPPPITLKKQLCNNINIILGYLILHNIHYVQS